MINEKEINKKPPVEKMIDGHFLIKDPAPTISDPKFQIIDPKEELFQKRMKPFYYKRHFFQTKTFKLDPEKLDSLNNMLIGETISPVPDEDQIPDLPLPRPEGQRDTTRVRGVPPQDHQGLGANPVARDRPHHHLAQSGADHPGARAKEGHFGIVDSLP